MQYAGISNDSIMTSNGTGFKQHSWLNVSYPIDVTTENLVITSLYSWFAKRKSAQFFSTLTLCKI